MGGAHRPTAVAVVVEGDAHMWTTPVTGNLDSVHTYIWSTFICRGVINYMKFVTAYYSKGRWVESAFL